MKEKLCRKIKQNKAFTLMEMLVTLSIIIVLLGVSVIGISDLSKKIKMTELDNQAKIIYLEAQNQLSAMEAEGSLPKFYNEYFKEQEVGPSGAYVDRYIGEMPQDYDLDKYGNFYKALYYYTGDESVASIVIPANSLSNDYGNYLLEINPVTGDVYGVFYWEDDNEFMKYEAPAAGGALSEANQRDKAEVLYTRLQQMVTKGGNNNRSLESRTEYEVGYYGGYVGSSVSTSAYKLNQKVNIVNGEELYLQIMYDLNEAVIDGANNNPAEKFNITITIEGESSGVVWKPEFKLDVKNKNDIGVGKPFPYIETGYAYEDNENAKFVTFFLLDGVGEGNSFEEIAGAQGFIPGENLKISVKTIYEYNGLYIKETTYGLYTNSLFHDVTENDGERIIEISSVRHLRNLGEAYYSGAITTNVIRPVYEDGELVIEDGVIQTTKTSIDACTIQLVNDIDYAKAEYLFTDKKAMHSLIEEEKLTEAERATYVDPFIPINNTNLFYRGDEALNVTVDGSVDGSIFVIKNLLITSDGTTATGLFEKAKNVNFVDVRLEDCQVNAPENSTYTGALVGLVEGGKIVNAGAYLAQSFRDENGIKQYYNQVYDSEYGTLMAKHLRIMTVTGGDVVGGLVGKVDGTYLEGSFSSMNVRGVNTVGGLVGSIKGTITGAASGINTNALVAQKATLKNSYATGDVYATGIQGTGGLIGYAEDVCIDETYTTGEVRANDMMGGFVGVSYNSYYEDCYSYGEVLTIDGASEFNVNRVGGFYALASDNHGNINTIGYLSQVGYNSGVKITDYSKEYNDLTAVAAGGFTASSYPYEVSLLYKAFPFRAVTDHHYGNWPSQYFINTSLVYYEKYQERNGRYSYGYYSVTRLTDISQAESGNGYVWVLDSLRDDKVIVEDGYALLTMFYLESVDYTVYQAVENPSNVNGNPIWNVAKDEDTHEITGTLTIVENPNQAGDSTMVNLTQQGSLIFNAYDMPADSPYTVDYSSKEIKSSFVTTGMYMYQLPYELQNTYRYNVENFYDVIEFTNGYAKGNAPVEGDSYEPTPVIDGEDYYYCPHFPKLAVNPGVVKESGEDIGAGVRNLMLLDQPVEVALRSARHLNNLGRVPYYWNNRGGTKEVITYNQELDINFSTYTKKYCGNNYNLLAFDTEYANQPIGQNADILSVKQDGTTVDGTGNGAFQNNYQGNYHKIIDYCVKSDNQYVGLFGEIYKAPGAVGKQIENVIMTVSDANRGNKGNYLTASVMNQNNAGLIISTYQDTPEDGVTDPRVGVGALIGSDYTTGAAFASDDSNFMNQISTQVYTVYNCASEGYEVQYHAMPLLKQSNKQPKGIAIGGLIGYSRGNVAQSMANNDVTLVLGTSLNNATSAVLIGGFSGSSHDGTSLNCYSGGTIDVDVRTNKSGSPYGIDALYIGGFSPGWLYADGVESQKGTAKVTYINVYSYTTLTNNVAKVKKVNLSGTFNTFVPCVSRMELNYNSGIWGAKQNDGHRGCSVPGYAYYVASPSMQAIINNNDSEFTEFYKYSEVIWGIGNVPKTGDVTSAQRLSDLNWVKSNYDYFGDKNVVGTLVTTEVKFITSGIYSSLQKVTEGDYPFPAYLKDADDKFVHYGDWPKSSLAVDETISDGNVNVVFKGDNGEIFGYVIDEVTYSSDFQWKESDDENYAYYAEFKFDAASRYNQKVKITCKLPYDGRYIDFDMSNIEVGTSGTGEAVAVEEDNSLYYKSGRFGSFEAGKTYRIYAKVDGNKVDWVIVLVKN